MPHSTKPAVTKEADLAVNRALLAHAELQRNLKRLLGESNYGEEWNGGGGGNETRDWAGSDEDFVAEDETAGLTLAAPSAATLASRSTKHTDQRLRRQLLGRAGDSRESKPRHMNPKPPRHMNPKPPRQTKTITSSSSDEDESRSALGRPSNSKSKPTTEEPTSSTKISKKRSAGGNNSYLDELLASRAAKKKKAKTKNGVEE